MDLFIIPRRLARLPYRTARLPLTILDECVVARLWDDQALPRLRFEASLGLMDGVAGWLLADDHISRRSQALMRRIESSAMPDEHETTPQARGAQFEENLRAAQEAARQARQQADERINGTAAYQQQQEDSQQARRLVKYRPEEADHLGSP